MNFKDMKNQIEKMIDENYEGFVKALISVEKGVNDREALKTLYDNYMDNDGMNLLHEEFDYMIEDMKEQGLIKEDRDDLVSIVGYLESDVEVKESKSEHGTFTFANFSLVGKDADGNKRYTNFSAYGEKAEDMAELKKGDFLKVVGEELLSTGKDGKEYTNIKVHSTKLLKAKEQSKSEEKTSTLGMLQKFQDEIKNSEHKDKPSKQNDMDR